jgi:hypothetical protein
MASLVQAYKASVGGIQYMFGVEIPKSVKHALELDKANGNNLWRESINKELEQINDFQTFRRLKKGEHLSATYQRIPYFIVFANKFNGGDKKHDWWLTEAGAKWIQRKVTPELLEWKLFVLVSSLQK